LIGQQRRVEPVAKTDTGRRHWITNPWHAVSVVPASGACDLARRAGRTRYLSTEAPTLPLKGCGMRTCTCRYRHHEDRRNSLRRHSDVIASGAYWAGRERRVARGRRATDGV
jgi:hypothetical protein